MKLIHLQGSNSNVGLAERLGPGLQNQLEWSNSTTRLQMPLWCNCRIFCGIRIVVIIPACHAGDGSSILPCRSQYGSDGREV